MVSALPRFTRWRSAALRRGTATNGVEPPDIHGPDDVTEPLAGFRQDVLEARLFSLVESTAYDPGPLELVEAMGEGLSRNPFDVSQELKEATGPLEEVQDDDGRPPAPEHGRSQLERELVGVRLCERLRREEHSPKIRTPPRCA